MAIRNTAGAGAGLQLATSSILFTNFSVCGLFRHRGSLPGGDGTVFGIFAGYQSFIYLISHDYSGGAALYVSYDNGYQMLSGSDFAKDDWVGIGMTCAGTGSNQMSIIVAPTSGGAATSIPMTIGGPGGSISQVEVLLRTLFATSGSLCDVQNFKIGAGVLSASQIRDETWSLDVENPGLWSPIRAPMTDGDLTTQASPLTVVNPGGLSIVTGPLVPSGGGSPTLLSRRRSFQY
jgi:hypothetical protein